MDSEAFYDSYVARQLAVGVNERHRRIVRWLERFGLREGQRVLEIGSGVGTLTGLIAEAVGASGRLVGVDLSPRSIEVARERLGSASGVELLAGDALDVEIAGTFDVVVLPDVLEHIPLELHARLFGRIAAWLEPGGFALLHYPNPLYLEWLGAHRPDLLQAVEIPIHAHRLTEHARAAGLYLRHLETYSIWVAEGDYVVAVLRHEPSDPTFTEVEPAEPLRARVARALRRWFR